MMMMIVKNNNKLKKYNTLLLLCIFMYVTNFMSKSKYDTYDSMYMVKETVMFFVKTLRKEPVLILLRL